MATEIRWQGGKYEALGFVLIVAGFAALSYSQTGGLILISLGFVIFLIGRFM